MYTKSESDLDSECVLSAETLVRELVFLYNPGVSKNLRGVQYIEYESKSILPTIIFVGKMVIYRKLTKVTLCKHCMRGCFLL